jgi:cob(I)alamin adenosyltransferase
MWYSSGKGDTGSSSLFDGNSVPKNDPVFTLLGDLDEVTAALGLAISHAESGSEISQDLEEIQKRLSGIMGLVAGAPNVNIGRQSVAAESIAFLESRAKYYAELVENPRAFIFTGKTKIGACLDLARAIVRRAERTAVNYFALNQNQTNEVLVFLNRLSSFLYVVRLWADQKSSG